MYMAPIVRAPVRTSPPTALRRAVGAPVLLVAGVVMLPWLAVNAAVAAAVLAARATLQAIDYAGTIALGR